MGELLPNFKFKGSIGDFTAYEDPTTGKITIQSKGGASAEKIHNDPGFVNTRRTNYEFSGMSLASKAFRRAMGYTSKLSDYRIGSTLTGLMREFQYLDTTSPWGQRSVLISKDKSWLEGLQISRKNSFDQVLRSPVDVTLSRNDLSATIQMPAIVPGGNFFSVFGSSYCQWFFVLGVVPDFQYKEEYVYEPVPGYIPVDPVTFQTDWQVLGNSFQPQTIQLALNAAPLSLIESASLVCTVAMRFGTTHRRTSIEPIRYAASGKIMAIV